MGLEQSLPQMSHAHIRKHVLHDTNTEHDTMIARADQGFGR